MAQVECQLADIHNADYHELGAAVDMIKDLAETIYYCTVTEAMEEKGKEKEYHYYTERVFPEYPYYDGGYMNGEPYRMYYPGRGRDMDDRGRGDGNETDRRYYNGGSGNGSNGNSSGNGSSSNGGNSNGNGSNGSRYYTEREYPFGLHDEREGRSPMKRRRYMEAKEMHSDEAHKMKELESYMQELTSDIAEMIKDASPSEKQLLQKKLSSLTTKVEQLNA